MKNKSMVGAADDHHVLCQLLRSSWIEASAYRPFDMCVRNNWVKEATIYNRAHPVTSISKFSICHFDTPPLFFSNEVS